MLRFRSLTMTLNAFFSASSSQTNTQFPFISTLQYNANKPMEDRLTFAKLDEYKGVKGYTVSVFDGHGGDIVAEFAAQHINKFLNQRIKVNVDKHPEGSDVMVQSLKQAYDDVENAFLAKFNGQRWDEQRPNSQTYKKFLAKHGACALTAIILKDKIYVGNAGDCEGIIVGNKGFKKTNLRLNAGQKFEQDRLKALFPKEDDIITCKKGKQGRKYYYVKGYLQPTRSFGDFYLKYLEYKAFRIKTFTGPYIDHRPLVTEFEVNDDEKYLMLATDGLWDELSHEKVYEIWKRKDKSCFTKSLFADAYENISKRNNIQLKQLDECTYRRSYHDDISIVTVDLVELRKTI